MMVLDYANNGSLRNYLDTSYNKLSWRDKFHQLFNIAFGLQHVHYNEIIHEIYMLAIYSVIVVLVFT